MYVDCKYCANVAEVFLLAGFGDAECTNNLKMRDLHSTQGRLLASIYRQRKVPFASPRSNKALDMA
jgi:hypothetical protein